VKSRRGATNHRRLNPDNSGHDGVYDQINIFPKEEAVEKPAEGEDVAQLWHHQE